MPKIIKNGKDYAGVPIECVTAWTPTGDTAEVAEPLMGNTDISGIGDGTITGAISANKERIITIESSLVYAGDLSANSSGYSTFSLVIPSGYKTTGVFSVVKQHPTASTSLSIYPSIVKGVTGTQTVYYTYSTVDAVTNAASDFKVNVQCEKITG